MSNRRRPSFAAVRVFAFIAITAIAFITVTAATNAAGFSFIGSVKAFLGYETVGITQALENETSEPDSAIATRPTSLPVEGFFLTSTNSTTGFVPQIVTTLGTPITQNFDTLPASGSATFVNDSTLPGWYQARTGTGNTIVADNGGSNAGNLYSYGCTSAVAPCNVSPNAITDRALGSLGSGNAAIGNLFWGIELTNNTGSTITRLDISYTGEQWRNSAAAAQTISFSYLIGSPTVSGTLAEFQSAGVAVPQLDFTSPVTGGTAGALNGNLAANRVTRTHSITGLNIPNGTEVMLRWSDPDHTGADHGLSIDDFSVTANGAGPPANTLSINDVSQNEGS
ncbi:MAG TPA: hypothetical protein VNA17_06980, partial [Pyrinomonadaceae bacterium]|nr:hypothetical protein [Pyrinomonadaceae bacterium]